MDFILPTKPSLNFILKSEPNLSKTFSDIINEHKLYENVGEIQYILNDINRGFFRPHEFDILINYNNNIPVACLIRIRNRIMCYVKPEFRRQHIGKNLVSQFKNEKLYAFKGFNDSEIFWNKMNIPVI